MALDSNPPSRYFAGGRETLAGEGLAFVLLGWIVLGILIRQGFSAEVFRSGFQGPSIKEAGAMGPSIPWWLIVGLVVVVVALAVIRKVMSKRR